ncbi:MAG: phenylacetate--CoA ligase family protein [Bacteroidales bacterium]|nr:phenylacetate--CoA ligase family protein [Bacteroidales bacterium]
MLFLIKQLIAEKSKRISSFDDLTKRADKRFRLLLKYVFTNSVFYRDLYSKHGITIKDIYNIKIDDLPFTSKEILMKNFDAVSCDPLINRKDIDSYVKSTADYMGWYKDKYKIIKTSGSTNNYGVFIYSKREWDILRVITVNMASNFNVNPFKKVKLASLVDTRGLHAGASLMSDIPKLFFDILVIDIYESQKFINEKLNKFQPDLMSGYVHGVCMCAFEQMEGRLNINPKEITTSGELLTDEARNTIATTFNCRLINMYAASESICIATSSPNCQNLHIAYDWNLLEVVDEFGTKITNGNSGNAVLTNLYNYSFPLIRYKMNDMISLHYNSCPNCDAVYPVIKIFDGRKEEILTFTRSDGSEESLYYSFINFFDEPNIKAYRIIQKEPNFLEIQLVLLNKMQTDEIIYLLDDRFRNLFLSKKLDNVVSYNFAIVDEIEKNEFGGKFARIITFDNYKKQRTILFG